MFMSRFILSLALMVAIGGLRIGPAGAAEGDLAPSVDDAMKRLSAEIASFVKAEPDTSGKISVGSFSGPNSSSAGARISQALRLHLKGKCEIAEVGGYSVTGSFMGEKQQGKFAIIIEAEIKNELGSKVQSLRRKVVTALDEGLAFFAPSSIDLSKKVAEASPSKPANEQAEKSSQVATEKLISSIVKPQVHLDDRKKTIMRPSADSPYGIEICIKQRDGSYKPLEVSNVNGIAKVDLDPKDIYAVTLVNDSPRYVGCRLTIDGINMFALSDVPAYKTGNTIMSLEPRKKFRIKGWHHTNDHSFEFKITNYGETAAARFGVFEGVGSLTATFFEVVSSPPIPEEVATRSLDFGTGVGELTEQAYTTSDVRFGDPVGAVTARYVRPQVPADLPP